MPNTSSHGGARKGAGRPPAPYPKKNKVFRPPSPEAWQEFLSYLSGDLVEDFEIVLNALRASRSLTTREPDFANAPQKSSVGSSRQDQTTKSK
jgi:hypothetical protein